ncbi:hypothetical protein JTE90_009900 [Oedothorax gibbosus]|uniref:Uncharacterized protein n=1 Tax=Oedothorax gibbosus TaxID=931172 RepID=A0AAV6UXE6_9ARAC|nr:hypothetical protein JTE90_009900 [Oedothorax gibbosus]
MKIFISLALLALIVVCMGEEKRCYSQEDCDNGYCCTGGITPWLKGSCKKLSEEGESCDPNPPTTGKYFLNCPCKENLKCDDSIMIVGKIRCIRE